MFSRPAALLATGLVVLGLVVAAVWYFVPWPSPEPEYTGSKTIRYSFTIRNEQGSVADDGVLRVYGPVRATSHQRLRKVESDADFEKHRDPEGNQVLEFPLAGLAPFEQRIISVRMQLDTAIESQPMELDDPDRFLADELHVETSHPELLSHAGLFEQEDGRETARAIYEWVRRHLSRSEYMPEDRGALWALRNGRGDCSQHMYLFMALARLHEIPARGVGGFVVSDGSRSVHPTEYHNWAEVYLDGAWHVVDPDEGRFMTRQDDYVAMRMIRPPEESLLGAAHRYVYEGDGISVSME